MVCQFRHHAGDKTLADFIGIKDIFPAGRLDKDSEGLLLLTDDGPLQHQITQPEKKMKKGYWVQIEGIPEENSLDALRKGVLLNDGLTRPAEVSRIDEPILWERIPPIRQRKSIPTSWLDITITEGKNRQVRRMTATTGYPVLRLIRYRIGPWYLNNLAPGKFETRSVPCSVTEKIRVQAQNGNRKWKKRH